MEGLKKSNTFWLANAVLEAEAGQLHAMPCKLGNALPLCINVTKWVGSLFTSGILHNVAQVKVKEVYLTDWTLRLKKSILTQKYYCEVGNIIAIN